jgi:hypothetical protein
VKVTALAFVLLLPNFRISYSAQTFLIALLDVVNCMVAVSQDAEVQSLVDRDIVGLVLPHCRSDTVRVRLQALWILGNIGTMIFKEQIVKPQIIASIVQVWNTKKSVGKR